MPKNQLTQRKWLIFEFGLMANCQKVPILDFQSQFSMSKIIQIFLNFFFHWRTPIFEHIFFVIDIFWLNDFWSFYYILKWWPIFDSSPIIKNSKFNNFLWVCWFICKNIFNLVPPLENSTTRTAIMNKA